MTLQRRTLALAIATAALSATGVFTATGAASADQRPSQDTGMVQMHELMRKGNPGMVRMHELMMTGSAVHEMHSN